MSTVTASTVGYANVPFIGLIVPYGSFTRLDPIDGSMLYDIDYPTFHHQCWVTKGAFNEVMVSLYIGHSNVYGSPMDVTPLNRFPDDKGHKLVVYTDKDGNDHLSIADIASAPGADHHLKELGVF